MHLVLASHFDLVIDGFEAAGIGVNQPEICSICVVEYGWYRDLELLPLCLE